MPIIETLLCTFVRHNSSLYCLQHMSKVQRDMNDILLNQSHVYHNLMTISSPYHHIAPYHRIIIISYKIITPHHINTYLSHHISPKHCSTMSCAAYNLLLTVHSIPSDSIWCIQLIWYLIYNFLLFSGKALSILWCRYIKSSYYCQNLFLRLVSKAA